MKKHLCGTTKSFAIVMIACLCISGDANSSSSTEVAPKALRPKGSVQKQDGKGEFKFRVRIRDNVMDARTWLSEVRVYPADGKFPNIDVNNNGTTLETSVHVILSIKGIDVPPPAADYTAWHRASEREEERFDASEAHVWKLLSAAEYCVIKDPVDVNGIVQGQVFVVIGGIRYDLGESLIKDGFAMRETPKGIDWRQRIPMARE